MALNFFRLLVLAIVTAGCHTVDVSAQKPMKLEIVESWKSNSVRLAPGGQARTLSKTEEIPAKRAIYEIAPNPIKGRAQYSMVLIHDSRGKKQAVLDGDHSFYISTPTGIKGYTLLPGGDLIWSGSYLELPDSQNGDTVIAQFEKSFDSQRLIHEWEQRLSVNRLALRQVVPQFFFSDGPYFGSGLVDPQVESVDVTNGILRLSIKNPRTLKVADIAIDLNAKQVVKSVVDGAEMDVSTVKTNKPFAQPLNVR